MSTEHFFEAYRGMPPWDIGRHQPAFERALREGDVRGPVLDAGCGTGENALYLAAQGFDVAGVDAVLVGNGQVVAVQAKAAVVSSAYEMALDAEARKTILQPRSIEHLLKLALSRV